MHYHYCSSNMPGGRNKDQYTSIILFRRHNVLLTYVLLVHANRSCIISMPHCTPTSYVTSLDQRVWLGSKPINQGQVIRWMTMPAAPDGILETLTVVASLDVHQPRTRLDVQQDVVPVKKQI